MVTPGIIALIPARGGSQRIKNKNIKPLAGKPLLAYAIAAVKKSDAFSYLVVSSDSEKICRLAMDYGATPILRPPEMAEDDSPDIQWVRHALEMLLARNVTGDYAILRPTSPFRSARMIRDAYAVWTASRDRADSLRAVQPVSRHPGKMWVKRGDYIFPILPWEVDGQPWHSNQKPKLPEVYEQNASLEISKAEVALAPGGTIAGNLVVPFFTQGYEGLDLNTEDDWAFAEMLIEKGLAKLPEIKC